MSMLQVIVVGATNVPNVEKFGESDPYTTVEFKGEKKKTEVQKSSLNPNWGETFDFDLKGQNLGGSDELLVEIKDWERVGRNRLLAKCKVPLRNLLKGGAQTENMNLTMQDGNGRPTQCQLNIKVNYKPPPSAQPAAPSGGAAGQIDQEGGDVLGGNMMDLADGEEEEEEDTGPPQIDPTTGQPVPRPKKRRRARGSMARRMLGNLSTKATDFQIRVKIIEARQLQGDNIQPCAKVTVANQTKTTRVKKSTNSPYWNEPFFFNFHMSPLELFEDYIEFRVFNAKTFRADSMIGSFKMEIGQVYLENRHAYMNKWLLLSDEEAEMKGAKGYLKMCVCIVGPGDDAPSFKSVPAEGEDDIESNLLRPAGVQLQPATFTVNLFRAEDIPRMDSNFLQGVKKLFGSDDNKELVDPYFVLTFAGKQAQSKIMYNNDHPDWNQALSLGIQFPSMCDKIKFIIKDWDRISEDDPISSARLEIPTISVAGETGFLPTFGPCYVNFYGSTREFSELPDDYEDLNLGKGEGVAYRGRALVELATTLGQMPDQNVTEIESDNVLRVQKFMRRRKFKLHAAFLNATMVSAIDAPVEFELSIGNYGNKLDDNVPPCSSTTQPTNAVFDGCHYYYLPWGGTKPCVVVDCSWEDISFRLETLNLLLTIVDNLEGNIEQVKIGTKAKLPTPELAQLLMSLLEQLVNDCRKQVALPQQGRHVENNLDKLLRTYRKEELQYIIEEASNLRENATDINEAISEVEGILQRLKNLAQEPQNSMPDVILWMISGDKRIAYYRIPANEVLYSSHPDYIGRKCGKIQSIQMKYPGRLGDENKKPEVPALVRCKIWLGLVNEEQEWHKMQTEGELAVYAETYENQLSLPIVGWTSKGPLNRPKWSDSQGKVKSPKDKFDPPPGWRWDSEWYISPELSMLYDKDAGHKTFMEDVYEVQSRMPGTRWVEASRPWTDVKGDPLASRTEIQLPVGWSWEDEWEIDLSRAVDEEGFEYCVEATIGGYGPVEKTYHLCRRRRWVRNRRLVDSSKQKKHDAKKMGEMKEGWEYAPLFNLKFHLEERTMDLVRRRRWHRKMVAETLGAPCFFSLQVEDDDDKENIESNLTAPRMFLTFDKPYKYQLRCYIYQARDLLAGDESGLSDPYARVSFLTNSMVTEQVKKSLCPCWDQTLIFEELDIYGDPRVIEAQPPNITIEIYDHDKFGANEFLGRCVAQPMVKLDPADARMPVLQWYEIKRNNDHGGELLAAFELFLLNGADLPFLPPKKGSLFLVPNGIRPVMQRTGIEVLCWGVRNMKKFQLSSVTSPSIEFECGGHVLESKIIKNTKKNPNFEEPILFFDVMLPREELYMPPMNVRIKDHREFGRKPTVGIHVIKSLETFRCNPLMPGEEEQTEVQGESQSHADYVQLLDEAVSRVQSSSSQRAIIPVNGPSGGEHVVEMPESGEKGKDNPSFDPLGDLVVQFEMGILAKAREVVQAKLPTTIYRDRKAEAAEAEADLDWWSKYYASGDPKDKDKCAKYLKKGMDKLKIYDTELEKAEGHGDFADFCHSFNFSRGKDEEDEECNIVGELKGGFRVYPLPPDPNEPVPKKMFSTLPQPDPEECTIRIYVINASDLQPADSNGKADPYIEIELGKKKINDRDDYVPNTTDPVFGRMFELNAVLPVMKDLTIRLKDYDIISSDDLIGETVIDLENRYLSKQRATCGIPKTYSIAGINQWRDSQKPKEILEMYCRKNNIIGPLFHGNNSVKVGSRVYNISDFESQNRSKKDYPNDGPIDERLALHVLNTFPIVKEHIESRPLFNPVQPNVEQGRIQMFVDIFPTSLGPPGPPFKIEPRRAKEYVLRCIIWNTVDVKLDETSLVGESMSDIYVKGWVSGIDEKQKTDVHYRSLDGEGNFNWRFVFPFEFIPEEQQMVIKKKEHFWSLDETVQHLQPIIMMQIWDNDIFNPDDFLGTLSLNLNAMPKPAKSSSKCQLDRLPDFNQQVELVSLFDQKRLKGYWPVYGEQVGENGEKTGQRELTGKIEMELELVTKAEAEERPSGQGQEEPNMNPHLDPPKRPETSFFWLASPWKSFKHIIWRNYKWWIIGFIVLVLVLLLLFLFIYSLPGDISGKIIGN
ncbi:myoferlin-like isoform X13 [Mytilus edulis]|uniref:myoferlin-like isoform X13 n=1 Tax=Mytilus edulis TaxID=6550 RepID=UPI0039EEF68E